MVGLLWALVVILVVLWLLGLVLNVAGGLIHVLLIVAVVVVLYNLFINRRTT
ncbi:MAG TPA: lmo0937 family membrane protein [Candidatus Limnocylindrales bacterium]